MQAPKNITVIPATINPVTRLPKESKQLRRVAAYARVSTDSEEQLTSYEAQVDYYTRYIQGRPDWEFVGVYTDEGISATNTKRREGFNRMVQDPLAGKIDLIVTKSVSRFARNTVDSLTTVRKLKDAGVEVFFEKENIWTLDSKGELLITIMSSLAQEESRSISENVTWGQRKRFADGRVSIPYGHFLGYRKGANGLPEIVPEEAEVVRTIYRMFIEGQSTNAIARHLTQQGIPTPANTLDADSNRTLQELDVVAGMIRQMVNENANQATDQVAYADRYNSLVERYEKLQTEYDSLLQQKERRQIQAEAIGNCLTALEELDLLDITFTDALWNTVVDHVTVYADGRLMFHFKNGTEIIVWM